MAASKYGDPGIGAPGNGLAELLTPAVGPGKPDVAAIGLAVRSAVRAAVPADSGTAAAGIRPSRLLVIRSSAAVSSTGAPTAVTPGMTLTGATATSLVVMIVADFDDLENSKRVLGQHRGREIQRYEIRSGRIVVDAHEAHG